MAIHRDDYRSYNILDGAFTHESVNHSFGKYAKEGDIHTDSVLCGSLPATQKPALVKALIAQRTKTMGKAFYL